MANTIKLTTPSRPANRREITAWLAGFLAPFSAGRSGGHWTRLQRGYAVENVSRCEAVFELDRNAADTFTTVEAARARCRPTGIQLC